jgi:hypothetical protein
MGMLVTAGENALLNLLLRNVDYANIGDATGLRGSTTPGSLYFTACTAWPGEAPSQTTNEATYTGYTRAGVTRATGSWSAPSGGTSSPVAVISRGERTDVGSQEISFFTIGTDAAGAGTAVAWGALGDATFGARVAVANNTTNDTFFVPGHGLAANDRIAFFTFEPGGTLPTGVTEGTVYHVISTGLTTDEFKVSTTQGGGALDITAVGSALAVKIKPITVTQNVNPQLKTTTVIRFS